MSVAVTNLLVVEASLISSASNTTAPVAELTLCMGACPIRLVTVTFLVVAVPETSTMGKTSSVAGVAPKAGSAVIFLFAISINVKIQILKKIHLQSS